MIEIRFPFGNYFSTLLKSCQAPTRPKPGHPAGLFSARSRGYWATQTPRTYTGHPHPAIPSASAWLGTCPVRFRRPLPFANVTSRYAHSVCNGLCRRGCAGVALGDCWSLGYYLYITCAISANPKTIPDTFGHRPPASKRDRHPFLVAYTVPGATIPSRACIYGDLAI